MQTMTTTPTARFTATPTRTLTIPEMSPAAIRSLMRRHHVTIRELAARMQVTMKRVRWIREHGAPSFPIYCDYYEGITGSLTPRLLAGLAQYRENYMTYAR